MKQMIKKMAVVLSVALVCAPIGAMAASKLIVKGTDGTTDKMVVTDTGKIGVGISIPTVPVHVVGSTIADSQIILYNNVTPVTGAGGGGLVGLFNNTNNTLPTVGQRLGYFYFGSYDGTTQRNSAGIAASAEANFVGGASFAIPTYMTFETAGSTGNRTEKMRITGSGNIGVGTFSPQQKIDVNGNIRFGSTAAKPATCNSTIRGTFWFQKNDTTATTPDTLDVCAKDSTGAYVWKSIF